MRTSPATPAALRWVVAALFLAAVAGLFAVGPSSAPRPTRIPVGAVEPARGFPGFASVGFTVDSASGGPPAVAHCGVLAATPATRSLGLMGRRGLDGYAGMLFTFPVPSSAAFYMAHTLIPVSLAWFDAGGGYVGQTDMAPCPSGVGCHYYYAPSAFSSAIEVRRGGLPRLGIGPGSALRTIGPCIG